jgi:hypothetical protein
LGASRHTGVAYNWEDIRAGVIGFRPVCSGMVEMDSSLRAYWAPLRQDEKKLMLTTFHEHHFSYPQDFIYFSCASNMK